jgi:hypothetical protein
MRSKPLILVALLLAAFLAADHINEMIAKADDRRQARQARRARL